VASDIQPSGTGRNMKRRDIFMEQITKVTIENGSLHKSLDGELFVGMSLTKKSGGFGSEQIIAGGTSMEGMLSAIRMLRLLEDQLFELLPIPRPLAEIIIREDEKRDRPNASASGAEKRSFEEVIAELLKDILRNPPRE
jgi:hypothetical protein